MYLEGTVARGECHGGQLGKANNPSLELPLVYPRCDLDHSGEATGYAEGQPITRKAAESARTKASQRFERL